MQTRSLQEFTEEAERFAASLEKSDRATVVALSGELGAGKTTFTQILARHFGIEETVASPTFVLEKIYEVARGPFARLIHIDAYRLKEARELEALRWQEIVADPQNLIVLEWPEHVTSLIPPDAHRVALLYVDENEREISYGEKST